MSSLPMKSHLCRVRNHLMVIFSPPMRCIDAKVSSSLPQKKVRVVSNRIKVYERSHRVIQRVERNEAVVMEFAQGILPVRAIIPDTEDF